MAEWISVEDRLPDEDVTVITYCPGEELTYCSFLLKNVTRHGGRDSPKDDCWYTREYGNLFIHPTHWQPLPSPPINPLPRDEE